MTSNICLRCGESWLEDDPERCPKCRSPVWGQPRTEEKVCVNCSTIFDGATREYARVSTSNGHGPYCGPRCRQAWDTRSALERRRRRG